MKIQYNDGGRSEVTAIHSKHDCVVRAVAIAASIAYPVAYNLLYDMFPAIGKEGVNVYDPAFLDFMRGLGFIYVAGNCAMQDIPEGRVIACTTGHYTAIIDGVIQDVRDESHKAVSHYWVRGTSFRLIRGGNIVGSGPMNAEQALTMRRQLMRYNAKPVHLKSA